MNCQDVIGILDHVRLDRLEAADRRQVEAHVAGCAECAGVWNAQAALAALPDEPMPAGLAKQCIAALTASVAGSSRAAGPGNRRIIIWGALTAVAAAAVTWLWLPREMPQDPAAERLRRSGNGTSAQLAGVANATQATGIEDTRPRPAEAVIEESMMDPRITVEVIAQDPAPAGQEPLQATATDPFERQVRQSLQAALVEELRRIPNVQVVQQVPRELVAPARHYRLQIAGFQMLGVDGRPTRAEGRYNLALQAQEVKAGVSIPSRPFPFAVAVDPLATCTSPDEPATRPCDVATTAAFLVRRLRKQIFPADRTVIQPLQAGFRDFSRAPEERFQDFVELFRLQSRESGRHLLGDPQVVDAAVELAGLMDSTHRAQLWRALRGNANPQLIDPLLASLQQDSREARIAAAETLALDFSGDPRVQSALDSVASADPDSMVRALARRGVSGEGAWQAYVLSSLKDSALPASRRVEGLLHVLYPPDTIQGISDGSPANYRQTLQELDDASVTALAESFTRAEQLRKFPGNNLIGNFASTHSRHPAVKKMLLTVLEQDSFALNRSVAGEALAVPHLISDPQVRQALARAVSNDPDARVRDYLRQVLDRDYVKRAMEASAR